MLNWVMNNVDSGLVITIGFHRSLLLDSKIFKNDFWP